ncbi:MAG: YdcF family protein [Proteobacteria bacterium]|nr:YdcF family protein [Pseudomonadota bacterium]
MLSTALFIAALFAAFAASAWHVGLGAGWRRIGLHALGPALGVAALATAPSALVVEKLLARLIFPTGLLWLGGFVLAWWLLLRGRRRAAIAVLCGWMLYSLAGNSWVGHAMLSWLEAGYRPPAAPVRFDAVIALGGSTDLTPWGQPQLSLSGDRLRVAAELYHRKRAFVLVCTGSSIAGLRQANQRDLAAEAARLWIDMGVPETAIVKVPGPHNTRAEIAALTRLAGERGWQRIGLVTSAWHLRRAMRLAGRHGLDAVPIPADVRGHMPLPSVVGVVPSGAGFYGVQIAWKEIVGAWLGR